ncbi:MAG: DUF3365 domain-containing protein [Candidatus Brocadiales bacterium]|nr:DUF3365 domain-containing protein [Candidatus Bathyanammoxibius amoris]
MRPLQKTAILILICGLTIFPAGVGFSQIYDFEKMSRNIIQLMAIAGFFIADNLDVINMHDAKLGQPLPEGKPYSHKGIDPVTFAKTITRDFTTRTGIEVRFVSEGKGEYGPRNPADLPDQWELAQINRFQELDLPQGAGFGEFLKVGERPKRVIYRYFYPLYITERCLKCHGDPANSPTKDGKDITNYYMENYKPGELRGGISLIFPVQ